MWLTNIQRTLYQGVKGLYPHSTSLVNLTGSSFTPQQAACTDQELGPLLACFMQMCTDDISVSCLVQRCPSLLQAVSYECRVCVLLNDDAPACATNSQPASNYERSYGLMLLSRKRLTNIKMDGFLNISEARGYIKATVSMTATESSATVIGQIPFLLDLAT